MKKIFVASLLVALGMTTGLTACHGQVPPASNGYNVNLSWNLPVPTGNWLGCISGQPTCSYAVFRCVGTAAACANTSGANWLEITNPASRPTTLAFTDPNATGLSVNYDVETEQSGANSGPSNIVSVAVPGIPLAPALNQPTTLSASLAPASNPNMPVLAMNGHAPMNLRANMTQCR